jgi:hypothetical protein
MFERLRAMNQTMIDGGFQAPGMAVAADRKSGVSELQEAKVHLAYNPL